MTYFLKKQLHRVLITLASLIAASTMAYAANSCTQPPGCPEQTYLEQAFPKNTNISVSLNTNSLNPGNTSLVNTALSNINANSVSNGSGNMFSLSSGTTQVTINFDTTTTAPDCHCSGETTPRYYADAPNTLIGATITIYLAGTTCGGACFDRTNATAFNNAVAGTIDHELNHTLGAGDSDSLGVLMGPFSGTNNKNGTNNFTPCDSAFVKSNAAARATGRAGSCS